MSRDELIITRLGELNKIIQDDPQSPESLRLTMDIMIVQALEIKMLRERMEWMRSTFKLMVGGVADISQLQETGPPCENPGTPCAIMPLGGGSDTLRPLGA